MQASIEMPILLDTLVLVTVVLLWTVLVRKFPNILSKGIVKRIEHGYDKKLEELKGEIQADNSAIKSSVEFLAASQSELRVKIISSVESLWQAIGCIQEEYSDALGATALLEPHEFYKVFRGELPQIHPLVKDYKDLNFFEEKRGKIQDKVSGTEIIFVSSSFGFSMTRSSEFMDASDSCCINPSTTRSSEIGEKTN